MRGIFSLTVIAVLVGGISLAAGGYKKSAELEQWKEKMVEDIEKIRYGEDTLPKGDLRKAAGLLDGEDETLKITMNQPQQL